MFDRRDGLPIPDARPIARIPSAPGIFLAVGDTIHPWDINISRSKARKGEVDTGPKAEYNSTLRVLTYNKQRNHAGRRSSVSRVRTPLAISRAKGE